ncbi:hypothetical protein [Streptomyces sp. NBC_00207]|uniref:hypothetical protein n=1 Tax=unclassified Streptomyces TaxID=2593676 RepID=UPI002885A1D8|nr:hypothetical protein [Streptomyces sp. DSM 41633]
MAQNSGTLPWISPRRRALRRHAALVAAALRRAEANIDREGHVEALPNVARLLLIVADNHAAGRFGALLPESELADLEPVRSWDWLRLLAVAVGFAVAAVVADALNMPDPVTNVVVAVVLLLSIVTAYGVRRGHSLFQFM